ncbi:hypothetical protein HRF87_00975 [Bacillus sp. CRN 9]|nr:hypothetical protein [Bacillus sp. CRN 9]
MKVQIVGSMIDATLQPTEIGQRVVHEDGNTYKVTEVVEKEIKTNNSGQFVHITWVNIVPI